MKLKINPKFKPCPEDDEDELFLNGIFHFNITKMLQFIKENPDSFPIEIVGVESVYTGLEKTLDEAFIPKANLSNPIILGEISPNRFNVIDGNHRLEKAYREGVSKISAYRISPKDHLQFLTSETGYRAYVGYWNEKLNQLE